MIRTIAIRFNALSPSRILGLYLNCHFRWNLSSHPHPHLVLSPSQLSELRVAERRVRVVDLRCHRCTQMCVFTYV